MVKELIIDSISQAHQLMGLAAPKHPLVSVVKIADFKSAMDFKGVRVINNLYQITLKELGCGNLMYGKNSYDYEEGTLVFTSPGQVTAFEGELPSDSDNTKGWTLAFHPDLIRKSGLADKISHYSFFSYEVNEALHLSEEELKTIEELLDKIEKEYSQNIDKHSQNLIISNIELLLDYCTRFYDRQFYTRSNLNLDYVSKFEKLLKRYYETEEIDEKGLPSVQYLAKELNFSSNYLSDLLKKETGKTAQEHIHLFVIEKAKNKLLNSKSSISEIGYALGFEYPQHFSNLFKAKTGFSPKEYRNLN
ncbi:helix-turn-helix domain-containing protein [Marivirga atlantica]|jgi:AraC-like DNA-binding protein|uniref:AraC family transcriptional regulator n=1 Tax=Marivirga atlantica TaxID=1548457 RepID=A0A937AE35_9BACT|nr:helix-turn-helix domain-containing protein [Marivirga atlantica]MBL0765016.1 AraC family transcriptional regulator [Marivirga atlantica]